MLRPKLLKQLELMFAIQKTQGNFVTTALGLKLWFSANNRDRWFNILANRTISLCEPHHLEIVIHQGHISNWKTGEGFQVSYKLRNDGFIFRHVLIFNKRYKVQFLFL